MSGPALGPGGEFDRIRRIVSALGPAAPDVGSDCAVVPDGPGLVVVSSDLSIEGVHFHLAWLSFEEIGWRAAAGALSDLAASGATPVGVMASVGSPRGQSDAALVELMRGVGAAAMAVGGVVLGGDLSSSPQWVVDITVLGRAAAPLSRRGAHPGDGLWLTGAPGLSRAALTAWRRGEQPEPETRAAFAHPEPRVAYGRLLAEAGARAMVDLSDGLAGDASHLAAASEVAVNLELDLLPLAPAVIRAAARQGTPAPIFAAEGGEDYELLAALPPQFGAAEASALATATGVPLTRVGAVVPGRGVRLWLQQRQVTLAGYDHFA